MKRVWKAKEVIKGWQDKPLKATVPEDPFDEDSDVKLKEITVFDAMIILCNVTSIGNEQICKTLEDGSRKKALKKALLASIKTGYIELDNEDFKFLKRVSELACPLFWQDNANEVHDILTEGFRKENEPSESASKKKGKKGKDAPPAEESTESHSEEE